MSRLVVQELLGNWLSEIGSRGYRGLVVAHSSDTLGETAWLTEFIIRKTGVLPLCIAPSEFKKVLAPSCSRVLSPSAMEQLLGMTNKYVVVVTQRLLRPNLLAAAIETVAYGGAVLLVVPPLQNWNPGGEYSIGTYKRYLINRLLKCRSLFWYDSDRGVVYVNRIPEGKAVSAQKPEDYEPSSPLPKALLNVAATLDQAIALDRIIGFLRKKGRSILILGDRGRGKSGLLALTLAYLIKTGQVGFVPVTAPSPWSAQSLFTVLSLALKELNIKHWMIKRYGVVVGVAGPWFHVRYHTPDKTQPGAYTVIDEAAALGPSRLRILFANSPRVITASTIHGYEGSGRILAKITYELLKEPRLIVELKTPVRYAVNDPLEDWVYKTFMLRVEPPEKPGEFDLERVSFKKVNRTILAEDYEEFEKLYSILVEAHYRNEPDDLALILDASHHELFALYTGNEPVAVADTAIETSELPYEARMIYDILARIHSGTVPKGLRVVRIAVLSSLQRRGLGSKLLRHIEDWARANGFSWIGAVFGRPEVLGFWLKNGYLPIHISPLPNRTTGEHNIGVAKPLNTQGEELVYRASADLLTRVLFSSHNLYRSLPVEVHALILKGSPRLANKTPRPPQLSDEQLLRARKFLKGEIDAESILDVAYVAVLNYVWRKGGLYDFSESERRIIAGRLLQGRPMRELLPVVGSREDYTRLLKYTVTKLLELEVNK
jgi:tRNA(Met) cytidine acetyltransferase